jgi:hypothetical protein
MRIFERENKTFTSVVSSAIVEARKYLVHQFEFLSKDEKLARQVLVGTWKASWYASGNDILKQGNLLLEENFVINWRCKNKYLAKSKASRAKFEISGKETGKHSIVLDFHGANRFGVHGSGVLTLRLLKAEITGLWLEIGHDKDKIGYCFWKKIMN